MVETKVLDLLNSYNIFPQKWKSKTDVDQSSIDEVQDLILEKLSSEDIALHNNFAYSNSVEEYSSKPVNMKTVPELPLFMELLPNEGLVLELGAGHLRDTLYMIDPSSRKELNREEMDYEGLEKKFRVVPFENSKKLLKYNINKLHGNWDKVPVIVQGDFMKPWLGTPIKYSNTRMADDFSIGIPREIFDGIWSCAAYMIHMAPGKLEETTKNWARGLKKDGLFAVSYINKKEGQGDMKILASRSAPGEIKIFSHYNSEEVDRAFNAAGLKLIDSSSGDYTGHGHIMKDFFGSAIYRKK